jgi:hypothetical protein
MIEFASLITRAIIDSGVQSYSRGLWNRFVAPSRAASHPVVGWAAVWSYDELGTFATARVTLGENCHEELHIPPFTTPLDVHPPNIVLGVIFRARGKINWACVCGGHPRKLTA